MSENLVQIPLELTEGQAWDLAQLLKRITFSDVRSCATDNDEAYRMIHAVERVRDALALVGISPR